MKITREHIPVGRDNAITRQRLCEITGQNDRTVRHQISELRAKDDGSDMVIVSVSNGRGYFRSNNPDDIRHFIAEMQKRNRMRAATQPSFALRCCIVCSFIPFCLAISLSDSCVVTYNVLSSSQLISIRHLRTATVSNMHMRA